jgi:hypothetical protein
MTTLLNDTSKILQTPERFTPESWDDIAGNQDLKEYWQDCLKGVRTSGYRSGYNLLVTGGSREGKTSTISFGIKALLCCDFDLKTMNPCHQCVNCTSRFYLNGTGEWHSQVDYPDLADPAKHRTPVRSHFVSIDCSRLREADVNDLCMKLRVDDGNLKIVYLDEVHRLARRNMDEMLLKPLEDYHAIWIASSAVVKKDGIGDGEKLDKMFQNRFSYRLQTQRPTKAEMVDWLLSRCEQFSIMLNDDAEKTLSTLIERSNRIPGMALHVLNKAHKKDDRMLTLEMVEKHIFDLDD